MKKINTHKINWELVAEGLCLSQENTIKFFDDGRIISRLGEFKHAESEEGVRQNENSIFDVMESNDLKTEVRAITKIINFASSKEIGSGRSVTEEGFKKKLNGIDRYVLVDSREIRNGHIETIEITKQDIENFNLGKNKSLSAKKFYKLYDRN